MIIKRPSTIFYHKTLWNTMHFSRHTSQNTETSCNSHYVRFLLKTSWIHPCFVYFEEKQQLSPKVAASSSSCNSTMAVKKSSFVITVEHGHFENNASAPTLLAKPLVCQRFTTEWWYRAFSINTIQTFPLFSIHMRFFIRQYSFNLFLLFLLLKSPLEIYFSQLMPFGR